MLWMSKHFPYSISDCGYNILKPPGDIIILIKSNELNSCRGPFLSLFHCLRCSYSRQFITLTYVQTLSRFLSSNNLIIGCSGSECEFWNYTSWGWVLTPLLTLLWALSSFTKYGLVNIYLFFWFSGSLFVTIVMLIESLFLGILVQRRVNLPILNLEMWDIHHPRFSCS